MAKTKQPTDKLKSSYKAVSTRIMQSSLSNTVQDFRPSDGGPGGDVFSRLITMQHRGFLPAWWSTARDKALEALWHESNLLSGAMYAMASKMATIPFHIEPLDMSITQHMRDADFFQRRLLEGSEYSQGWDEFFTMQVQSLLGQDNGRFFQIIDASRDKTGPVVGPPLTITHLDPARCTRTGDPTYPVVYTRMDGKRVRLHFTRVGFDSQLPSTRAEMFKVGFSAVSRATHYARHMLDISRFKDEKLGSRPIRGILLAGGGLDAGAVGNALEAISAQSDAEGFMNFSLLPIVGDQEIETPSLDLVNLSSLPEGFDEELATATAMAAIALAMGVDIRELWPSTQQGATRADALLQHIKQRGKGPGHIITRTEHLINAKFLPAHLQMVFDYQDDAQDRQRAEIGETRARTRRLNSENKVTDSRVERELMLNDGEINQAQFNALELASGRLPDGRDIQVLFFSAVPEEVKLLTIPNLADPLDFETHQPQPALKAINAKIREVYALAAVDQGVRRSIVIEQSLAALKFLRGEYEKLLELQLIQEAQEPEAQQAAANDRSSNTAARTAPSQPGAKNDESETAVNQRPDDEDNAMSLELNPREFSNKNKGYSKTGRTAAAWGILENAIREESDAGMRAKFDSYLKQFGDTLAHYITNFMETRTALEANDEEKMQELKEIIKTLLTQTIEQNKSQSDAITSIAELVSQQLLTKETPIEFKPEIVVNVPEQKAPVVNVAAPEFKQLELPAPVVHVHPTLELPAEEVTEILRDADGNISGMKKTRKRNGEK